MTSKNKGLTVGELTMTVGALILATLIWTTLNKKESSEQSFSQSMTSELNLSLTKVLRS